MGTGPAGTEADRRFMARALDLAARGLGTTWPNPSVGAVIVDAAGRIVGEGQTQPGGRPHAETVALAEAGPTARGGTAYVTLEPCSHHGRTPPCAEALIAAGIARVVVAHGDPAPWVAGRGLAMLAAAGIVVTPDVGHAAAAEITAGFLCKVQCGRPLVTLKLGLSADGRIATAGGESRWITGPLARAHAHRLRATHDAIMVGSGTVLADDPLLDVRLPGLEARCPVRVVVDSRARLPLDTRLVTTARRQPVWLLTSPDAATGPLAAAGVEVVPIPTTPAGTLDLPAALQELGTRGLTRLMVEGGGALAAALLRADLVDRLVLYHAPLLLGGDGLPGIGALDLTQLAAAPRFERREMRPLGPDTLTCLARLHDPWAHDPLPP